MTFSFMNKKFYHYKSFLKEKEKEAKNYFHQKGFVSFLFLLTFIFIFWSFLLMESFLESKKIMDLMSFVRKNKKYEKALRYHSLVIKTLSLNPKTRSLCSVEIIRFQTMMSFVFKRIVFSPYNNLCFQVRYEESFCSKFWCSYLKIRQEVWEKKIEKKVFIY